MTTSVPLGGRMITVDARWRLVLAVSPVDRLTGLAAGPGLEVGVEPDSSRPIPPGRSRGRTFAPPTRFDRPLPRNRSGAFTLVHRVREPDSAGDGPVQEIVLRIADPARGFVPRRLRVPVRNLARLVGPETGPPMPASARSVAPVLFPGAAYAPPGGCTGMRGRLVRSGTPLPWARITAVGGRGGVLGRAQGDERGEFLLLLTATGDEPMAPPVRLTVWLDIRAAPSTPGLVGTDPHADPLGDLVVEDAVRRGPDVPPGELDQAVLRGVRDPAAYVLVPERPTVELTVGAIVGPPPLIVT